MHLIPTVCIFCDAPSFNWTDSDFAEAPHFSPRSIMSCTGSPWQYNINDDDTDLQTHDIPHPTLILRFNMLIYICYWKSGHNITMTSVNTQIETPNLKQENRMKTCYFWDNFRIWVRMSDMVF